MKQSRGSLYLLTGFILGLGVGLIYSLFIQPVNYTDIAPSMLDPAAKDHYRSLIAIAYNADQDIVRARARLALLRDDDPFRTLAEQAQRWLAEGKSADEARALGILAVSLAQAQATILAPPTANIPATNPMVVETANLAETETPISATPHSASVVPPVEGENINPTQLINPSPSPQLTATVALHFQLSKRESVCDPTRGQNLIQVYTWDANGVEAPGVEIVVNWEGGENHFFTGLKPEMGAGYADFNMTPGITYTLRLANGGEPVLNLTTPECTTSSGEKYWGNWILEFSPP